MLRLRFHGSVDDVMVRMQGEFAGKEAQDTLSLLLRHDLPPKLVMDLSNVKAVDEVGESVLSCFSRLGVTFIADDVYALKVCERLHLPLDRTPTSNLPQPQ